MSRSSCRLTLDSGLIANAVIAAASLEYQCSRRGAAVLLSARPAWPAASLIPLMAVIRSADDTVGFDANMRLSYPSIALLNCSPFELKRKLLRHQCTAAITLECPADWVFGLYVVAETGASWKKTPSGLAWRGLIFCEMDRLTVRSLR